MAGAPLAQGRSYGCLNWNFLDEGMGRIAARLRSGVVDSRWGLVSKTGGLCVAGWSRSWAVARGREPGPAQPAKRAAGSSGEMGWAPRAMRWALWGEGRV